MHKDEYPTDEEDPLEDYCTADILHDYKMLIEDFGPEDDLVKEMIAILVSRHRHLSNREMADLPQSWENALVDTSRYFVSATLIFEIDEWLYDLWDNLGYLVQTVKDPESGCWEPDGYRPTIHHYVGFDIRTGEGLPPDIDNQTAGNIIGHFLAKVSDGTS